VKVGDAPGSSRRGSKKGIITRPVNLWMPEWLRITVGTRLRTIGTGGVAGSAESLIV